MTYCLSWKNLSVKKGWMKHIQINAIFLDSIYDSMLEEASTCNVGAWFRGKSYIADISIWCKSWRTFDIPLVTVGTKS